MNIGDVLTMSHKEDLIIAILEHNNSGRMTRIRSKIDKGELLAGIAEESGELTQAALKLRRTIDGRNLTPVTRADAEASYIEELADVLVYAWAYGIDASKVASVMDRKIKRWDDCLGESDTDDIL